MEDTHCCSTKKVHEENKKERIQKRKIYNAVQEGEMDKEFLYREGQPKDQVLMLADEVDDDNIIAIVKDDMDDHDFVGADGTVVKIEKGKCHHCGSNRVKTMHQEPAGIGGISCPVCGNDTYSSKDTAKIEVHTGDE